jgi:predicted transcriptional regulator
MAPSIRDRIRTEIRRILAATPDGCGWYSLEMRFGISRQEFPPNTNIMTFIEELESEGEIHREKVEGRERFVLVRSDAT